VSFDSHDNAESDLVNRGSWIACRGHYSLNLKSAMDCFYMGGVGSVSQDRASMFYALSTKQTKGCGGRY